MKVAIVLSSLAFIATGSAYVPSSRPAFTRVSATQLAITKEEDLELTRKVIADFMDKDEVAVAEPAPPTKKAATAIAEPAKEEVAIDE